MSHSLGRLDAWMQLSVASSLFAKTVFMHNTDHLGVFHPRKVSMMIYKLLARVAVMHNNNQGPSTLNHNAALKGLTSSSSLGPCYQTISCRVHLRHRLSGGGIGVSGLADMRGTVGCRGAGAGQGRPWGRKTTAATVSVAD